MAQQAEAPDVSSIPDPKGHPIYPEVLALAPGIFVPITEDFTTPLPAQRTRTDRHQAQLAILNHHITVSNDNMLALASIQHANIIQTGRRQDVSPSGPPRTSHQDIDAMIAYMKEPHDPNVDYNVDTPPMPTFDLGTTNARELTSLKLMDYAKWAADQLETREGQLAKTKEAIEKELRQEWERVVQ